MSFCGQCGQPVETGAHFCGSCGTPTTPSEATTPATTAPTTTVPPADVASEATVSALRAVFEPISTEVPIQQDHEWLRPARRSVSPAAIIGFVALVLLAAGATVLLLQDDEPAASPTRTTVPATEGTSTASTTSGVATTEATTVATTAPTTAAPTTVALAPGEQLAATLATDREQVEAMVGRWVPQLSAKKVGTVDDGITYDLADIVTFHHRLQTEYGALLLYSGDYVYQTDDLWVSVAPESFATAQGALAWCVSEDIGRDDCFAKLITHDESITDSVQMQP